MQVAPGRGDVAVAQELLDGVEVYAAFQEMGCKAVAQGMHAAGLGDARTHTGTAVGALGHVYIHGLLSTVVGKQPSAGTFAAHVVAQ